MITTTGPGLKAWIKELAKAKGAVIEGKTASGAIVAVEVPLAITNPHPIDHEVDEATTKTLSQQNDLFVKGLIRGDLISVISPVEMSYNHFKLEQCIRMGLPSHAPREQFELTHPQE